MSWNPVDWVSGLFDGDSEQKAQEERRRKLLEQQSGMASDFAGFGQGQYMQLGREGDVARQNLSDIASGKLSLSGEQLRQGMQQNLNASRAFAASGSPQNAAMNARNAAMQMGRANAGVAGQAAMAGIAERQAAAKALQDAILQQRQQDMNVALGSRQNAITALGAGQPVVPEKSIIEKYGPTVAAVGGLIASDERLKKGIVDGDKKAKDALEALSAKVYKYKDKKYGDGEQLGIIAQDLERAGLKQAVIDTPDGKMVHAGKLGGALAAMTAAIHRRVSKLEGEKK